MSFFRRTRSYGRPRRFELLETRSLLAGNVGVIQTGGLLTITGDAAANNVQISQLANGDWLVKGIATKINGANSQECQQICDEQQLAQPAFAGDFLHLHGRRLLR